jgi:DNA-binding transcriptional ArsR family regulator
VINLDRGYTYRIDDLVFTPPAIPGHKAFNDAGYRAFAVTNQSGVARGGAASDNRLCYKAGLSVVQRLRNTYNRLMSAGLGRVQRAILAALEAEGQNAQCLALAILPNQTWVPKRRGKTPLPSAIESIRRALRTLERRGLVEKAERRRDGRWTLMGRGQALRDDPFGFRSHFQDRT